MVNGEKRAVVLYCRVSSAMQAAEGLSLEAQESKMRSWADLHDCGDRKLFVDAGISGKQMHNRPALLEALDFACKQKAIFLVYSISRLARNTKEAIEISERLNKAGADLVSLVENFDTTSSSGRLLFEIMSVLASFESRQIGERVSNVIQYKQSRQEYTGGNPEYGWMIAGLDEASEQLVDRLGRPKPCGVRANGEPVRVLVENPYEQDVIRAVRRAREEGLSLRKIAARLEADGILPRTGTTFGAKLLNSIVTAEVA